MTAVSRGVSESPIPKTITPLTYVRLFGCGLWGINVSYGQVENERLVFILEPDVHKSARKKPMDRTLLVNIGIFSSPGGIPEHWVALTAGFQKEKGSIEPADWIESDGNIPAMIDLEVERWKPVINITEKEDLVKVLVLVVNRMRFKHDVELRDSDLREQGDRADILHLLALLEDALDAPTNRLPESMKSLIR